ncbi:MAG TPA: rod shape-determining protein MreC [Candidatus Saccharimonadales bacterium]|nr:rod shape-determining protein MreC [Candidatus Saccharimonadales bacterium]
MRKPSNRTIIITIAIAVGVVVLGRLGYLRPLTTALDYTTTPVRGLFRNIGSSISSRSSQITGIGHLQRDNARLQEEVNTLKQRLADDTEIRQQNDILRRQLQIGGAASAQLVAADVIGYQPDNFRQFLTIAKGSNDGLKVGQAVVADGVLVGTISETSRTSAKVFLLSDPNFKVNGIDQASRASGTVHGQLGSGLVMDKIAQGDSVSPGDTIVTSGLGGDIPKGIIIGQVESVDQRDNQVFQVAQVASTIRVSKLELVFVMVAS